MDLWTDPNLVPYMAVTAHWIQARLEVSQSGSYYSLAMRADLIGFQRIPGHHTGEHLADSFIEIIDRLGIQEKVFPMNFRFFLKLLIKFKLG